MNSRRGFRGSCGARAARRRRPSPAVEALEERCLLDAAGAAAAAGAGGVIKFTFGDTQNNLYVLKSYSPQSADVGPIDGLDPALNLVIGVRYTAVVASFPHHPLELIAGGASPFDDVVLLAQTNKGEPGNQTAKWEHDPGVDWTTDPARKAVSFTLTPALAEALFDPARGLTPQYRCGNPFHRGFQRGPLLFSSGAPTPKSAPHDGFGGGIADASTLATDARGSAAASGTMATPGGVDVFRYVAPATGTLTVTQSGGAKGTLGNLVLVYDGSQTLVDLGGSGAAGATARVQIPVVAGATYFIQASGYRGSVGAYHLAMAVQPQAAAAPGERALALDGQGSAGQSGNIPTPGGQQDYQLTATTSGEMTVTEGAAPGSQLDPLLKVNNDLGMLVAADNDGAGAGLSRVRFRVTAGQTYHVQAGALGLSLGRFALTIGTQDFGDSPDEAQAVAFSSQNTAGLSGQIEAVGEGDYYQFAATFTGSMSAELDAAPGSTMRVALAVDGSTSAAVPGLVETSSHGGTTLRAVFPVVEGRIYQLRAAAVGADTGGYRLGLGPTAPAAGLAGAQSIPLSASGSAAISGAIGLPGDAFFYRFTAPITGPMAIAQQAAGGTALDSVLAVYDASGARLATDDDGCGGLDSLVRLSVTAGQTYYVRASGYGNSTGQYTLTLATDVFGHTFATASPLPLDATGSGRGSGSIGWAGAADVFRIVAPTTGDETLRLDAAEGSTFDGVLQVFDAGGNLIDRDDDGGDGYNSRVDVHLVAGRTYYLKVSGSGASLGGYDLLIGNGLGDGSADAFPIALGPGEYASQTGWIDQSGEATTFRFVAPKSGMLTVIEASAPEGPFVGTLAVLDGSGRVLAHQSAQAVGGTYKAGGDIDELSSVLAKVLVPVVAGQTYDFRVAGQGASTGQYLVDVALDDADSVDDDSVATTLALDASSHSAGVDGRIALPGDLERFRVTAPLTGELVVNQGAVPGDFLGAVQVTEPGTSLMVSDTAAIGGDDPQDVGKGYSRLSLHVTAGATYLIEVGGVGSSFGSYHLDIREFPTSTRNLSTRDLDQGVTPEQMVATLLGPGNSTVQVVPGSVAYAGIDNASGTFAGGAGILDSRDGSAPAFSSGIVLTNGNASNVIGPNDQNAASEVNGVAGSPLLDRLVRGGSLDASTLTFRFVPTVNVIQFRYVFASEEYGQAAGSTPFNDVFGFFVNGLDYARVPGTGTPSAGTGQTVSVNSINDRVNSQYYLDNTFTPAGGFGHLNTQMNGLTRVLTLTAPVRAGQVNTITLTIADTTDPQVDSAVFVQAGSLQAVREQVPAAAGDLAFSRFVQEADALDTRVAAGQLTKAQIQFPIQQVAVDTVLKAAHLTGDFLVIPIDPVDFTLTGPDGLQVSAGAGQGASGNVGNAFYVGDGANQLLVIPNANPGHYQVSLVGIGGGASLFGASYVSASGAVTSVLLAGDLRGASTSAILDFQNPDGGLVQGSISATPTDAAPTLGSVANLVSAAANSQVLASIGVLSTPLPATGPGADVGGGPGQATGRGGVTTPVPQPSAVGRLDEAAEGPPDPDALARELAALLDGLRHGLLDARSRLGLLLGDGCEGRLGGVLGLLRPGIAPSGALLDSLLARLRAKAPAGRVAPGNAPPEARSPRRTRPVVGPRPAAPTDPRPGPARAPGASVDPPRPAGEVAPSAMRAGAPIAVMIAGIGLARAADLRALGHSCRARGRSGPAHGQQHKES